MTPTSRGDCRNAHYRGRPPIRSDKLGLEVLATLRSSVDTAVVMNSGNLVLATGLPDAGPTPL